MKKTYQKPYVHIKNSEEDEQKTIKVSGEMMLREVAGEYILIPIGTMALKIHGMISLTESGALLWNLLQDECTEEDLVAVLLQEYEIDRKTATMDVSLFVDKLRALEILE